MRLTPPVLWEHPTFGFGATWADTFCVPERWIDQKRGHFYEQKQTVPQEDGKAAAGQRGLGSTGRSRGE